MHAAGGITTELPQELKTAVEEALGAVPPARLRAASAALSALYRGGGQSRFTEPADLAAYAALRMPATYAAALSALRETAKCLPGFEPKSLLDAGAGPGTAAWAASAVWPGLEQVTSVERDAAMVSLGKRLTAHAAHEAVRDGQWLAVDLAAEWPAQRYDAVILSYSFGEVPEKQRLPLLRRLWACTGSVLIILEPGTPEGFARVRQARDCLLAAGAQVAAPCPGGMPCPMENGNWCHFASRVARSRGHRLAKDAALAYEDEKYTYVAAARAGTEPCRARVLRHPGIYKGHVVLELCTAQGPRRATVTRSHSGYKAARGLKWGGAAGPDEPGLF